MIKLNEYYGLYDSRIEFFIMVLKTNNDDMKGN